MSKDEKAELVSKIRVYARFAEEQIPNEHDDSDRLWEVHYMGYREAVQDIINIIEDHPTG